MFYETTYSPSISDMGNSGFITIAGLFRILDDIANRHVWNVGVDLMAEREKSKTTWVLLSWNVKILKPLPNHAPITAATWIYGGSNDFSHIRQIVLRDEHGQECAYACSESTLVDTQTGSIIRIPSQSYDIYGPEDREVLKRRRLKLYPLSHFSEHTDISSRRSDIDYNCHVHNTQYLSYVLEALPESLYREADYKGFVISYRKSILPEERIVRVHYNITQTGIEAALALPDDTVCASVEIDI